jgi:hypothetical protein
MLNNHPRLKNFFTLLGMLSSVLFVILLILIFLLFINIKNLREAFGSSNNQQNTEQVNQGIAVGEFNPNILVDNLSPEQKKILKNIGIDETNLPTSISKEQEECALEAIGAKRLNQIISGSTPTFSELLKAKSCI